MMGSISSLNYPITMGHQTNAVIQVILVPAGVESRAVKRALKQVPNRPQVVEIPAGPQAVKRFLKTWEEPQLFQSGGIVLMGLGGSLSPEFDVGDGVLVERVFEANSSAVYKCDRTLTAQIATQLGIPMGVGVTCDRVITTAAEKRQLRDRFGANVVDMEGAALLKELPKCKIAILRIISDDCHHDLPDIANAIGANGSIQVIPLTLGLLRHPFAALRLIYGSLKGLKTLETLTTALCQQWL